MGLESMNKKIFASIKEDDARLVMLAIAEESYSMGFNEGYEKGSKSVFELSQLSLKLTEMAKYKDSGKPDQKSYI